jgi:hypothetical protein
MNSLVRSAETPAVGRRLAASLFLACLGLSASAAAATDPLQVRAREVRNVIPSAEAYGVDHRTYAGMTIARLRRAYDRTLKNVVVRRATRRGYCVQSTLKPVVHYDGPAGPLRKGACGTRGAEVPRPGSTPAPAPTTAEQRLRSAVPAIEAFAADHGGYAGMSLDGIRRWDSTIAGITIAWATRDRYCIESGTGSDAYHLLGPVQGPKPGPCPAPPA